MKTLALATFKVRSLTEPPKQQQLIRDVTKIQQLPDTTLGSHRVIFFRTKSPHCSNGFIVPLQLKNNVRKY